MASIIRLTLEDFRNLFGGVNLRHTEASKDRVNTKMYRTFAHDRQRVCEFTIGEDGKRHVKECGPYVDPTTVSRYVLLSEPSMSAGSNGAVLLSSFRAGENRVLEGDENARMILKVAYNPEDTTNDSLDTEFFRGLVVNTLRARCPNFMYTYGYIYTHGRLSKPDPEKPDKVRIHLASPEEDGKPMSMLMLEHLDGETVYGTLDDLMTRHTDNERMGSAMVVLQVLVQTLLALQIAQNEFKYTHYDLNVNNVMLVPLAQPSWLVYDIDGQEYWLRTTYRVVIIDHARTRIGVDGGATYDSAIKLYKLHPSVKHMNTIQPDLGIVDEFNPVWDMATLVKGVVGYAPAVTRENRTMLRLFEFMHDQFPDPNTERIVNFGVTAKQSVDGTVKRPLDLVRILMHTALWNIDHSEDTGSWPVYDYGAKFGLRPHTMRQRPESAFFPAPVRAILDATPIRVHEIAWLDGVMQRRGRQKHTPEIIKAIPESWGPVDPETLLECRLRTCTRDNDMCGLCIRHYKRVSALQGSRVINLRNDRPKAESPGRAKRPRLLAPSLPEDDFLLSDEVLETDT